MAKVAAFQVEEENKSSAGEYGEPVKFDPNFKGPIEKRGCTDVICCLIFLAFLLGWVVVASFGFYSGQPKRLLYPTDTQGRICGEHEGLTDKKYLFFFDLIVCARMGAAAIINGCPTPQICVKSCPNKTTAYLEVSGVTLADAKADLTPFCHPSADLTKDFQSLIDSDLCPRYIIKSEDYLGRCIPSYLEDGLDAIAGVLGLESSSGGGDVGKGNVTAEVDEGNAFVAQWINAQQVGERLFQDFTTSWWMMLVALGISMVIAFVWIVLMRWVAGIMVWISIVVMVALFAFGTYYCFTKYVELKQVEDSADFKFSTELSTYLELRDTWLAFGIITASLLGITLLVVIFLRNRIRIAVELIKEGSKAVGCMMSTLLFPLLTFLMQVVVFSWWGVIALYVASAGEATYSIQGINDTCTDCPSGVRNNASCTPGEFNATLANMSATSCCRLDAQCIFKEYGGDPNLFRAQIYNLFGLFWGMAFVVALGQMALAGAFASYYWAFRKPDDVPYFAVAKSFYRAIRYHLGTIAFGSLLIAIVKIIRVLLEYLDSKLKGTENKVAQFFLKCLKCCFWCLEKFLKFLNKNAYIYCAIYGTNFCSSAKSAFFLLMRNIVRVFVIDKVTDFLFLIGKLVVVGATACLAFFFFSGRIAYTSDYVPNLNYYFVPVIVITVGSFVIASGFFNVYTMAVDTLFLCFLEDSERNDGTPEKPYFMSKNLMKILDKKNKFDASGNTTQTKQSGHS